MRCFIAVDFCMELKNEIAKLQKILRPYAVSGRWKYIDNFHLTLKFLDEIDLKTINTINKEMTGLCESERGFRLGISGIGKFPGKDSIRAVWLGINGDIERLGNIQQKVDSLCASIGFEKEKRAYKPHVTIAQDLVFSCDFDEIEGIAKDIKFPQIVVNKLSLVKSEQIANKRVYTPVSEFKLK